MNLITKLAAFVIFLSAAQVAQAGDSVALVIANKDYKSMRDVRGADAVLAAVPDLRDAGFDVLVFENLPASGVASATRDIRKAFSDASRVVIVVSGHVVSADWDSWLLNVDAKGVNILDVGSKGISLNALLGLAKPAAGSAVVMVAPGQRRENAGPTLEYGVELGDIPQGVTVLVGPLDDLTDLLVERILRPGYTTGALAADLPDDVLALGFLSDNASLMPAAIDDASAQTETDQPELSVEEQAKSDETELELSRDARREIQRNLSLLGFDTRGIDGIFGRGTRAAIGRWQVDRGFDATGYMSGNQISALGEAADIRAAELEEEALARRDEQERLDLAYWRDVGRDNGEDGLRAYLDRYPDGLYSDIAHDRLETYDAERRDTAAIAEARAWDAANDAGTIAAYQNFLQDFPRGVFSESAAAKLKALQETQSQSSVLDAARSEERRVLGNPITRVLAERQLAALGFKPGRVDGVIDDNTRKAVRKFQRAADLTVTGYVTQETFVRLLAGN